ncbi:nucleotidyltransferase domain-containing protein [Paenibacillus roseipurpureus]|uniref:Nucleotidyltransferase family protein n=1 Tax=Paenibacillus roseopurpureus TaxID=2918901 RepID=A0AA96LPV9_9BACL|nr:nucleotidyltransferase family protein [Paenibacillus sp. MBLB1832]WNR43809.1 nucleotidyltransferase family protein [Paenibacillus sp. MBLB1832]
MNNDFQLDLSQLPQELRVMLSLLTCDGHLSPLEQARMVNIDWDLFMKLAMHHRVYPDLYRKMKMMKVPWVPSHVLDALRKHYQKNAFQMLHLSAEMELLSKEMAGGGIPSIVLKGPVLAADLYGDVSLRTSRDLDILVPFQDLDRVDGLLRRMHYEKIECPLMVLGDWKWRHHHITYFHAGKQATVEIHWRLGPGPAKEPSFQELWERKRLSSITSSPVYYLGKEDLFAFLAIHGSRHGWSRLRWLVDMDQMVKQKLDAAELIQAFHRYGNLHIAAQALLLTSQLLRTSLPPELYALTDGKRPRQLAKDALFYLRQMVNLHTDPVPVDVSIYHKRHLFSLMSTSNKVWFILSFMYPYPEDVETLALPKFAQFLYFPLRPFLWAWRRTRKQTVTT